MLRLLKWTLAALMLVALAGCESGGKMAGEERAACCPKCHKTMASGACCPKCLTIAGQEGTVHCDKCNKDMRAGSYCPTCNRFMLSGTVHCDKCNKDVPKGTYCPMCKKYVGVESMTCCAHCKMPYMKDKGCPHCNKKGS